jgi:hypothetical protein
VRHQIKLPQESLVSVHTAADAYPILREIMNSMGRPIALFVSSECDDRGQAYLTREQAKELVAALKEAIKETK